jgi:hypothetical protein
MKNRLEDKPFSRRACPAFEDKPAHWNAADRSAFNSHDTPGDGLI